MPIMKIIRQNKPQPKIANKNFQLVSIYQTSINV